MSRVTLFVTEDITSNDTNTVTLLIMQVFSAYLDTFDTYTLGATILYTNQSILQQIFHQQPPNNPTIFVG